jgi:hypothetical protein
MQRLVRKLLLLAPLFLVGCPASHPSCVAGTTQTCLCVGLAVGVQSCIGGGAFSDCVCSSPDAAVELDAGAFDSGLGPDSGGLDGGEARDSGSEIDGGPVTCGNHVPDPDLIPSDPPFGTTNGRSFRTFTLGDCDGDAYDFYGADYCDPAIRFTVVNIAAGWCVPCMMESAMLTDRVVTPYGPRGVRVIQILVQDASYDRPDEADCHAWVDTYGLTNVELLDPDQITNRYFPDGSLPSTIIIDDMGVIRWHENGAVDGLTTLIEALDTFLAEP